MTHASELLLLSAIVVLVWLAGTRLWPGRKRGATRGGEAELLRICRGDEDQLERMLEGEQRKRPGMSRAEAVSRAVQHYRRDNR